MCLRVCAWAGSAKAMTAVGAGGDIFALCYCPASLRLGEWAG